MILSYISLAAAAVCGVLRCVLGHYAFSAATTLLCACAAACSRNVGLKLALVAGLLVSVVADWFLAHQKIDSNRFLYGVLGFFAAHCLFAWQAGMRFSFNTAFLVIALVLLVGYGVYMAARVLPKVESGLRVPLILYMLVSVASLYFALSMDAPLLPRILYIVGIAAILFSDTMIAENEFLHQAWAGKLVLPFYYACHVLITLSFLLQ